MLSGDSGFVCTSVVRSLFAAGYALDFCGDTRLVEACRGEFAGDVLFTQFCSVGFDVIPHRVNGAIDGECFDERCCERVCILLEFVYVCMSTEVDFSAFRFCSVCLC